MYSSASSRETVGKGANVHSPSREMSASSAAFLVLRLSDPTQIKILVSAQGLSLSRME